MKTQFAFILLLWVSTLAITSCNKNDDPHPQLPESLSLRAVGVATGVPTATIVPGINLEITGNAFTMDFFDEITGEKVGNLTDINIAAETFDDGSMKGENYTIFQFTDDNSQLILHNFVDMTPIDNVTLQGIIQPENTTYNLVAGTGRFAGVTGGSTLDAILDMTEFANGTIGFNCLYEIKLEL